MHRNQLKHESNQTTLARVKKEMDEPRMVESTREEAINQTTLQKLEAAIIQRHQEPRAVLAQGDAAAGGEQWQS